MTVSPLGFYILIELEEVDKVSKGGIILPDDLIAKEQSATSTGRIKEIGPLAYVNWPGCDQEGKETHECWGINVGDLVEFKKYQGMESVTDDGDRYRYIPDSHIVGLIKESE